MRARAAKTFVDFACFGRIREPASDARAQRGEARVYVHTRDRLDGHATFDVLANKAIALNRTSPWKIMSTLFSSRTRRRSETRSFFRRSRVKEVSRQALVEVGGQRNSQNVYSRQNRSCNNSTCQIIERYFWL